MSHYRDHLAQAQASLTAAMEKAGIDGMAELHAATLTRHRYSMPFGVVVYGLESDTVDRAAKWVKAWGSKHGFVSHDGGRIITASEMYSDKVEVGHAPKHDGVVRSFVVFAVETRD